MTCSNIYDLRKIPIYYEELKGKKILLNYFKIQDLKR